MVAVRVQKPAMQLSQSPWSMGYTATAAAMLQFSPLIRLKVSGALNTIQFVFNLEDSQDSE